MLVTQNLFLGVKLCCSERTLRMLIDNKGQTNWRCFCNGRIRKNNMNQHLIIYEELDEYPISDNSSDL